MKNSIVEIGTTYGRLKVVSIIGSRAKCVCQCGNPKETYTHSLNSGNTRSCGCLRKETRSKMGKDNAHSETYRIERATLPFTCIRCLQEKQPSEFYSYISPATGERNKRNVCKLCCNSSTYEYRERYPERVKASKRKHSVRQLYSFSIDEHINMKQAQKNLCAICHDPPPANRELSVDHCHVTNKVRGLLCPKCNSMLGMARDSRKILQSSIRYLARAENASKTTGF